jgi:hypothetical protein
VKARDFPGSQTLVTILTDTKRYADIPVPTLAVFAIPTFRRTGPGRVRIPRCRGRPEPIYTAVDALAEKRLKVVCQPRV